MSDATERAHFDALDKVFGGHGQTIRTVVTMMGFIPIEDLDRQIDEVRRTRDFGCFFDPTAWMKAESTGNPKQWLEFLEAVRDFKAACLKQGAPQ